MNHKIFNFGNIEDLTILDYSETEVETIKRYIELTRHLQEIKQLFQITNYNLKVLQNTFVLPINNIPKKKASVTDEFDIETELNALVINYISSGKTLVDALVVCSRTFKNESETHKEYQSKIYEGCFSYQLITHLRHFAQHGHIPIMFRGEECGFSVGPILRTPHYRLNAEVKKELTTLYEKIVAKYHTEPFHSFTLTLANYTNSLGLIYKNFWDLAIIEIQQAYSAFKEIVENYPSAISHKNATYNGYLLYQSGDTIHAVQSENGLQVYKTMQSEANDFCREQEHDCQYINNHTKLKRLD